MKNIVCTFTLFVFMLSAFSCSNLVNKDVVEQLKEMVLESKSFNEDSADFAEYELEVELLEFFQNLDDEEFIRIFPLRKLWSEEARLTFEEEETLLRNKKNELIKNIDSLSHELANRVAKINVRNPQLIPEDFFIK